ncbi:MAG: T9SS type A sorting domain-containing protein, partial [Planctomycetes bacterium]|nr:T9SS type A sorting domain-containing protein [Planctomycetota bacterium]
DQRDEVDTVFYLVPQDNNLGNKYPLTTGDSLQNVIQKIGIDSIQVDADNDIWESFGVYEARIENLLPSKAMYFSVTAFDFGNPITNLEPLESSPIANTDLAYPAYTAQVVEEQELDASVYPNPYKISEDYRGRGYEDPFMQGWSERDRRIHFVNLPSQATIKVYSIDGDLVREMNHPDPHLSDSDSHLAWDMVSRNIQAVVSGIYIYSIESDLGTQIGKLVIIK